MAKVHSSFEMLRLVFCFQCFIRPLAVFPDEKGKKCECRWSHCTVVGGRGGSGKAKLMEVYAFS